MRPAPTCDRVQRDLFALLDGELSRADVELVEGHLDACDVCGARWRSARCFLARIGATAERTRAPRAFRARLADTLAAWATEHAVARNE